MDSNGPLSRLAQVAAVVMVATGLPLHSPAVAADDPAAAGAREPVDIELVLAVDVSLSMAAEELEIQRAGYAAAITSPPVLQAIRDGVHGKIAVTYMEWAGDSVQRVIVPWTTISTPADADDFARRLSATPPGSARRTSISAALGYAEGLFDATPYRGLKRIIDISGDGPNNQGGPVTDVRDRIVAKGITINGLPLMTNGGLNTPFDVPDLDAYYTECVVGGPGAFMVPVNEWSQFPEAIRRKLVLELAGLMPVEDRLPVIRAQASGTMERGGSEAYDCLVGEKRWMDRSWMWESR